MRYSSENFSDFEFHDTELYLKDCENSNLRLTARYLNIHKEAEQNPHNCDMETDCAEILFENADIRLFETMEVYTYGCDGSVAGFEPRTVCEGADAADRLRDELKKGLSVNCVYAGSDKDGAFLSVTSNSGFVAVIYFARAVIRWDGFRSEAWYESTGNKPET